MVEASAGNLDGNRIAIGKKLRVQTPIMTLLTLLFGLIGAGIFALIYSIPMPYTMISLFKFGLSPALAIIALIGAIRGPLAGLLTGYLGIILHDLVFYGVIVSLTLQALAYGILGLIVGLSSYDFSKGRSLGKMSVLSTIGLVFTALILVMIGLVIENQSVLVELGFVLLPLLTVGLPSVILLTPILARLWLAISQMIHLPLKIRESG
ncbi:MAG: ECF transporter S component [Candidatus Thorarchaeota archaeon]|nr:ECF transporter S component [Candidatus Thorarchaeota archaeon]